MITTTELRNQLKHYLQTVEGRDTAGLFRCVLPGHDDTNPSMSLCNSGIRVKCFTCSNASSTGFTTFDLLDILRLKTGIQNFDDLCYIAAHLTMDTKLPAHLENTVASLEIKPAKVDGRVAQSSPSQRQQVSPETIAKRKGYIEFCQQQFIYPLYLKNRGISERTCRKLGIGCDPHGFIWDKKTQRMLRFPLIVFAMSNGSYCTRVIGEAPKHLKTRCRGPKSVINEQALLTGEPVFIVEGPFDLASLEEVGAHAISAAATNVFDPIVEAVSRLNPNGTYIISFDYDLNDDTRSRVTANMHILKDRLEAVGAKAYIERVGTVYNDPNEFLCSDRVGFEKRVKEMIKKYK